MNFSVIQLDTFLARFVFQLVFLVDHENFSLAQKFLGNNHVLITFP